VQSGNKWVCLFSPASGESSGSIPQHSGFDQGGSDRNALFASRSIAVIERDVAVAAQAKMSKEHDQILCEYNTVAGELESVKLELAAAVCNHDLCLAERDRLLSERDIACEKYDKAVAELSYISGQLDTVLMKCDEAVDKLDTVMQERDLVQMNNQNVLKEMQERQAQLLHRVAYLEAINKNQFTL
jgi:hypothetical protein